MTTYVVVFLVGLAVLCAACWFLATRPLIAAVQAVEGASDVSSARIDARLGQVRAGLARYSDQPKVAEFLDWSGQMMGAKANGSAV